ncbi:MAG: tRNA pseudouridine(55) synthase TruB [Gammaproteobacteria bacterium]|nr:tRNA pseudouridine(55) synthase TruB [Gammaproteobacteria bacterium]
MSKRRAVGRDLNGILLLDKPLGVTSNQILQHVKRLYFARKAGHTGSLDPLATGMLPICFGEATKFSQFLLDADKRYQVTGQLGIKTTTADKEGEIIKQVDAGYVNLAQLEKVLPQFRGPIMQVPSMFSALKHQGQPLYKLARQGIEIERPARPVTIKNLTLLNFDADKKTFSLDVECTKGTYIRNLVEDIGEALGCGAHVIKLHRVSVANFSEAQMISLETLVELKERDAFPEMDALLLPAESFAKSLPQITITEAAAFQLRHGTALMVEQADGLVGISISPDRFIGLGEIIEGQLSAKRLTSL